MNPTKTDPRLLEAVNRSVGLSMARRGQRAASPHAEVLEAVPQSDRSGRRQRQRDGAAMGRKSRRKAGRQRFAQRQAEQNLRGIARVYLQGQGTPAMQQTVTKLVQKQARAYARQNNETYAASLKRAEGTLMNIQEAYGDDIHRAA